MRAYRTNDRVRDSASFGRRTAPATVVVDGLLPANQETVSCERNRNRGADRPTGSTAKGSESRRIIQLYSWASEGRRTPAGIGLFWVSTMGRILSPGRDPDSPRNRRKRRLHEGRSTHESTPAAHPDGNRTSDQRVGGSNPSGRAKTTTCCGPGAKQPLDLVFGTASWATPMEARLCGEHLTPSIRGLLTLPSQRAGHLILPAGPHRATERASARPCVPPIRCTAGS